MTNHMCKYGRIRRINTAYTSIKPYSAYQLSPYRIRYGDVKFRRIRRINTIYNTGASDRQYLAKLTLCPLALPRSVSAIGAFTNCKARINSRDVRNY